ncbi:MAG TPA: hypothetical protein VFR87_01610 [Nocardioidaceae bacterium]|nr:hypothetical protein [Nocardioidaceae bacterium]
MDDASVDAAIAGLVARLADLSRAVESGADSAQLLGALEVLREIRERVAGIEAPLIAAARDAGASWAQLAPALGVTSRQAAERRFLRLDPTPGGATVEGRVRAVRGRRAGQRAVTAWARSNAAELRRVAGQVSTTSGLTDAAQNHADELGDALGGDDPATLLPLLETASEHVRDSHPDLADHIDTLTTAAQDRRDAATADHHDR